MILMEKIRFKDYLNDYLEYNNITNKDFARRLEITPKHLIDILSGKQDLSADIISKISLITDIPVGYIYSVENNYKLEQDIENYLDENDITITQYLNKYNYKYLIENKFITFTDTESKVDIVKDIMKFLRVTSIEKISEIERNAFYKSKNDKPELLLLWLEKCYRNSLNQKVNDYNKGNVDKLVNYINECAYNNIFNEDNLIAEFNKKGVYLVIENDIPGSKIRGAFKVNRGKPAIYLTKKHKRIADIYFALLHELAHCKSDFNRAMAKSFISYDDDKTNEDIEIKADNTAYNWMVDDDYYKDICINPNYLVEREMKNPKSFVVYRLANDKLLPYNSKTYQQYNFIVK